MKGFYPDETDPQVEKFRLKYRGILKTSFLPDRGFDIGAYFQAAESHNHEYLLFLNSYSVIKADNWLLHYVKAMQSHPDCGVVGATGSFMRPPRLRPDDLTPEEVILHLHEKISFPNPHIRTNAFMIRRDVFLNISRGALSTKQECYELECGINSLTVQIKRMGLQPVVVDLHGRAWREPDWRLSRTFLSGDQENNLIADNVTRRYATAKSKWRRQAAFDAWGEGAPYVETNGVKRYYRRWFA
jgi:hypothetical protein